VLSILLGILVASSAFLIPWWLDQKAFYQTYILRETVGKGPNGVGILESLLPNLSYHILPLAPLLLASLGVYASWVLLGRSTRDLSVLPGTTLAFLLALPTFVFFAWHPYRSEIYTLPAIPAVLVATVGLGRGLRQKFPKTWFSTQLFALSLSLLPSLLVLALHLRFSPTELWWPSALGYLTVCGLLLQVCVLIYVRWIHESNCSAFALLVWIPAFLSVAFLMKVLGHEDLKDLKYISAANPQHRVYGFYNAEKFVWSEWGLLNLSSGLTIQGLHDLESVRSWVMAGHPIIVKDDEERLRVEALAPELSFEAKIWFRWASHGLHSQEKNPRQAWLQRDLKLLRQKSYVMTAEEKAL
jgi:hypothetical protein